MLDETSSPDGASPVGQFADSSPITQGIVWVLRAWLDPSEGPNAVMRRLKREFGDREADRALHLIEEFFYALARFHSRSLQRHELTCPCIGADEALMGQILELAAFGQSASSMALATRIVRPEGLAPLLAAAPKLGRVLLRFPCASRASQADDHAAPTRAQGRDAACPIERPANATLH